jgi:hypothetical protein
MACTSDITSGRTKNCKDSSGGTKALYLFNFVEDAFTVVDLVATGINPLLTTVYKYEIEGDANTLAENFIGERQNGTAVNTQTATIVLKKQDATTSNQLDLLLKGYPQAVIQDRNGVYHAIGLEDGLDATIDATTGGARTDLNGYTLTLTSQTSAFSPKLDAPTVTAFLALVA